MTTIQQSPHQQLPAQGAPITKKGGGDVGQVVATAGSPVQQQPREQSWLSKNIKLVGILGGAAIGGTIGFLTLGPIGGLGGAAAGALAGYLLTANRGAGSSTAPPVPPGISTR